MAVKIGKREIIFSFLILFLAATAFAVGFFAGKVQVVCAPEEVDLSLFWQVFHLLQEKFIDQEKLDIQRMIHGAISGMVQVLGDPYTVFLTPEETRRFIEGLEGVFEGVGMEIGIREDHLKVITPLEGMPAQRAGLRAGDKILKIEGEPTPGMTTKEAVGLIRGPKGTQVTLTILREEWEEPREFTITRAVIKTPTLRWKMKEDNIAYLRIYHFSGRTVTDFQRVAREILNSPAERIVLDLRGNPGGYLQAAQEIAGWFLERGEIVVIEDFGPRREPRKYFSPGPAQLVEYPLVVLIDRGSASGAEILAGALRDNRGVILIGEKTFGKGSIQEFEKLRRGASLKITVARWLTPRGELIADIGLEPDIKVRRVDEEPDLQLEKAIEVIRGL